MARLGNKKKGSRVSPSKRKSSKKSNHKNAHKSFWVTLFSLLAISFIVMGFSMEGSITGKVVDSTFQQISFLSEGESLVIEPNLPYLYVAVITFDSQVKNGLLVFSPVENRDVFSSFEISSEDPIKGIDLTLKIKEEELQTLEIFPSSISVYGRNKFATKISKKEKGYVYLETHLPGAGVYEIKEAVKKQALSGFAASLPDLEDLPEPEVVEEVVVEETIEPVEAAPVIEEKSFFARLWDSLSG